MGLMFEVAEGGFLDIDVRIEGTKHQEQGRALEKLIGGGTGEFYCQIYVTFYFRRINYCLRL